MINMDEYLNKLYILKCNYKTDQPNIVYLKGKDESLMVDIGGGKETFKLIQKFWEENSLKEPDYVVLTHYHWDHAFASSLYKSQIISSSYTNSKIEEMIKLNPSSISEFISDDKQPEFCREHLENEYKDGYKNYLRSSDILCDTFLVIDLGERLVQILLIPSFHTEGSLAVLDLNTSTLIIGDAACGKIKGRNFIHDSNKIRELYSVLENLKFDYVIEGHSRPQTRKEFMDSLY